MCRLQPRPSTALPSVGAPRSCPCSSPRPTPRRCHACRAGRRRSWEASPRPSSSGDRRPAGRAAVLEVGVVVGLLVVDRRPRGERRVRRRGAGHARARHIPTPPRSAAGRACRSSWRARPRYCLASSQDTLITGRLPRPQLSSPGLCLQPLSATQASHSAERHLELADRERLRERRPCAADPRPCCGPLAVGRSHQELTRRHHHHLRAVRAVAEGPCLVSAPGRSPAALRLCRLRQDQHDE